MGDNLIMVHSHHNPVMKSGSAARDSGKMDRRNGKYR
jgi:hypothetical protein